MNKRAYIYWISLASVAIAIKIFSLFPSAVEKYYSDGLYPVVSSVQRFLFGWLPFSIGDVLYGAAVLYLIVGIVRVVKALIRRSVTKHSFFLGLGKVAKIALWIYILFNLFWGLNYNRLGIGHQLHLLPTEYNATELQAVLEITIEKLNNLAGTALKERDDFERKRLLFKKGREAYDQLKNEFPFMKYTIPSVKPSIFSYLGNYLGYTGYYNPFTGEAQVNTTVPLFFQPFTCTHEIGHQLGYAKEMEANFAGYLASSHSPNIAVRYSIYFDLYVYAIRNLYIRDSTLARSYAVRLPEISKQDVREMRAFFKKYENPFEPVIRKLYGQYLKANEQPQGILSYDEVLGWVIAYYRKYGTI
jgi:Protein of unknown function (DUF3810)